MKYFAETTSPDFYNYEGEYFSSIAAARKWAKVRRAVKVYKLVRVK